MLFDESDNKLGIFGILKNTLNQCYETCEDYGNFYKIEDEILEFDNFFNRLKRSIIYLDEFYTTHTPGTFSGMRDSFLEYSNYIADFFIRNPKGFVNFPEFFKIFISSLHDLFDNMIKRVHPYDVDTSVNFPEFILEFYRSLKHYRNLLFHSRQFNDLSINERFIIIENNLNKLLNDSSINTTYFKNSVDDFLSKNRNSFEEKTNFILQDYRKNIDKIQYDYENEIKQKATDLSTSISRTESDFKSTFKDYNDLKKLINAQGERLITDHYKKKALWERIVYWVMTVLTFIVIYKSINLAIESLDEYKVKTNIPVAELIQKYKDQPADKIEKIFEAQQNNALTYLVLRLALSILLFSTIIYTSRVAYRAYVHMRHSENMRLKLATLRPFINQLEEEERNQVHKDLVPDYFGKDAGLVDNQGEKFKDLPANISAVAMKAIEQISGSGSNSSTEKNNKKPDSETG